MLLCHHHCKWRPYTSLSAPRAITVNGDGDINSDFKAKDITVTLNDAGKAKLNVDCTNLTVSANGTGDVKVKGQCESFIKSEKGLSSVNSRDLTMNKTIIK